jgi:hypothetical protein
MLASDRQRGRRVLFRALLAYALVATAAAMPGVRQAWDEIFGPNDAQLVIISAAPIRNVLVTYDGRPIERRPDGPTRDVQSYAVFAAMRTRALQPVLHVSWESQGEGRSLSRTMRQFDSGRVCLYVLTLDPAGVPAPPERPDEFSPIWWTCYSR